MAWTESDLARTLRQPHYRLLETPRPSVLPATAQPPWTLILSWPPPLSAYHTVRRGQIALSEAGKDYQKAVFYAVAQQRHGPPPLTGSLHLCVELHPPIRAQKRDLDNHAFKAIQDSLQHANVYADDSQFVHIETYWATSSEMGYASVLIEPFSGRGR